VGKVCSGTVKAITDFGAFVDLGGVDGLLHITDMSWSKISHPSENIVEVWEKQEYTNKGINFVVEELL
jgi:ribosomal protein S1